MYCNWMQSLEELASDRSAELLSGRHPPRKPDDDDDDDDDDHHHHHHRRASRLFLQRFSDWSSCILLDLLQVCAICMHCSMPKVGNVEFSIAASPGVCMKPNTCNGLHCNVCMQEHLQKKCQNIHKLHKTTLKIFLLLSASFPSPDSSFEEDRPQSVSSSLENSFNLIFPAADHY